MRTLASVSCFLLAVAGCGDNLGTALDAGCTGAGQGTCRTGYTCAVIGMARGCVPIVP